MSHLPVEISEPFPLQALPYELLEEIGTWFTQPEAAKVLTVNKRFHEAFSRAVWRRLDIRYLLQRLPAAVWQRYGHLVRVADIGYVSNGRELAAWIPNVQYLKVYVTRLATSVFNSELLNLHALHVEIGFGFGCDSAASIIVSEWVCSAENRGQKLKVCWDITLAQQQHYDVVDNVVASAVNLSNHSFRLHVGVNEPGQLSQLQRLSQMLVELDIQYIQPNLLFLAHCNYYFSNSDISYPRLESLVLSQDFSSEEPADIYGFVNFVPSRFPSLTKLELVFSHMYGFECTAPIFNHTWPTVTELKLSYCDESENILCIIRCFPNVKRFTFGEADGPIDIRMFAEHFPQLMQLTLNRIDVIEFTDQENHGLLCLSNMKEVVYSGYGMYEGMDLSSDFLYFILHATPNLETLKLSTCQFNEDHLADAAGQVNSNVHTLIITAKDEDRNREEHLQKLMNLLPNVKYLGIEGRFPYEAQKWKELYPHIKVETVRHDKHFAD